MDWLMTRQRLGILGLVVLLVIGVGYSAYHVVYTPTTQPTTTELTAYEEIIATYYAPLTPLTINGDHLQVSIADTVENRTRGLSGTPVLPPGLGKLFVFDVADTWNFWMKDMQYPLDIIWFDEERQIVHIETNVAPATYPETVEPSVPARYVLEVNAGVSNAFGWEVGDQAAW